MFFVFFLLQLESLKEALLFVKRENIRLKGERVKVRIVQQVVSSFA